MYPLDLTKFIIRCFSLQYTGMPNMNLQGKGHKVTTVYLSKTK